MPQHSHHKGREREQGKGETGPSVTGAEGVGREKGGRGREKGGRERKAERGGAGEEQRRWARDRKKKQGTTHAHAEDGKESNIL